MTPFPAGATPLRCPVCAGPLAPAAGPRPPLTCPAGHRFDAAKQGYYNLLTGQGTGFREDTAAMVAAREAFLGAGHYAPLADAVAQAAATAVRDGGRAEPRGGPSGAARDGVVRVLDAGAGTGYYLGRVLDRLRDDGYRVEGIAVDLSRYGMRRAARLPGTTALVWDLWRPLPLADASVDVLLNVFAPRNGGEFARVLAPGGTAVVATPLAEHLAEAAGPLGLLSIAPGKEESVAARLGAGFGPAGLREVRTRMRLGDDDAVALALMGPAGHHSDEAGVRARLAASPLPETVSAAFRVQSFPRLPGVPPAAEDRPQG